MKKQILLPFVLLGSLGMVAALAGCTPSGEKGYGVEITNKDALQETWYAGSSRAIDINLTPAGNVMAELTTGALKIESSNPSVVSITGAVANALAEGSAKVTVKYHGWKDAVDLTIDHKQTIQEKYGVAHAGTSADPLTNEEAIAITNHEAYADGQEDLYVGGVVSSFYHNPGSRTDGAVSWFLEPAQGQTEKFEIYKCYKEGTGAASYLTNQDVWKGGYAVAHGRFTKYGDQCETSSAIFDRCEGEPPVDPVTIQATFAEALTAGKALEDGDSTYDYYQFDAYVTKQSGSNYFLTATKAEEITDEKANTIEIYGASADVAAKTLKNAKVTVKMIIKNYHGQVENGAPLAAADVTVLEAGEQWVIPEHTVTVAQGLEVINGLADGATTTDLYNFSEVYVKEVTGAYNAQYGNMSFTIADTADGTSTITVFRATTDAETAAKVVAGAQVTVKGNLQKYVKNEQMTPELLNVKSITVKGGGGGGQQGGNVTVAQALTACAALADNATSTETYTLTEVYVKAITQAFNSQYNNISFTVADTADGTDVLTIYRATTTQEIANTIVAGVQVTVQGNLKKYVSGNTTTLELVNAPSVTVKPGSGPVTPTNQLYKLDGTQVQTDNDAHDGSNYAKSLAVTQNGVTWDVFGNTTINPWRIGGKSITNQDRQILSKGVVTTSAVATVKVSLGNINIGSFNSLKLAVGAAEGSNSIDEITVTTGLTANSDVVFTVPEGHSWANAYFTFTFNVTESGSSNKYVQVSAITFLGA